MLFLSVADWLQVAQLIGVAGSLGTQIVQMISIKKLLDNIVNGAWLLEQARKWGVHFDKIIINYANKAYNYFVDIVGGTLITPSVVEDIMSRLYIIVGIFIFFRLAITAIKYIINPEQFLDDKVGAQTLVKRIILGAVIIIAIPIIFNFGTRLQTAIIDGHLIEKVLFSDGVYNEIVGQTNNQGRNLAMTVFFGFFSWDSSVPKDGELSKIYNAYERVETYYNVASFDEDYMLEKSGKNYAISYVPIICTLAVGYLLYMLIKYAIEVAFRSFKLVFLQLISPFVVVNYMLDPSQEETMKKWTNAAISTYIMIFIRLLTLWFAVLIAYYLRNGIPTATGEVSLLNTTDPLLKALIVIAVFAFLKDLPKIVSEIFGYNLQENETITGIMNQGVGALKGFALGKVGMDFSKKQMGYNMASTIFGGVSGMAGAGANIASKISQSKASSGGAGGGLGVTPSVPNVPTAQTPAPSTNSNTTTSSSNAQTNTNASTVATNDEKTSKMAQTLSTNTNSSGTETNTSASTVATNDEKTSKMKKFHEGVAIAGSVLAPATKTMSGITSTMAQTLSTSMGSTVLSPIAQSGSIAASGGSPVNGDFYVSRDSRQPESSNNSGVDEKTLNSINEISKHSDYINNMFESAELKNYVNGDSINLSSEIDAKTINDLNEKTSISQNPVINQMSKEIQKNIPEKFEVPIESIQNKLNDLLNDKNIITDSSKCSKSDISRLMDTTISDIMKNINSNSKSSSSTPKKGLTTDGLESIIKDNN